MSDRDIINGRPIGVFTTFWRLVLSECDHRTLNDAALVDNALIPIKSGVEFYGNVPLGFITAWGELLDAMHSDFSYRHAKQTLDMLANTYPFDKKRPAGYAVDAAKRQLNEVNKFGYPKDVTLDLIHKYIWNIYRGNFSEIVRSVNTYDGVSRSEITNLLDKIEPQIKMKARKIAIQIRRRGSTEKLRVRQPRPHMDLSTQFSKP